MVTDDWISIQGEMSIVRYLTLWAPRASQTFLIILTISTRTFSHLAFLLLFIFFCYLSSISFCFDSPPNLGA